MLIFVNMNMVVEEEALGQPLRGHADPGSDAFARNHAENAALAAQLRDKLEQVRLGGPEQSRKRHTARGKLLPRDRVDTLLDPGSPFLELSPSPRTACTAATRPPPASSPESAASAAGSASSSPTTPP